MGANIRIFINIKSASGEIDHLLDVAVVVLLTNKGKKTSVGLVLISIQNLQCGGRERRWFGDARGRGARRVGDAAGRGRDAGRWFVSGVRCGFGGAAGWGVTRADVVRGGLERGAMGCQRGAVRVRRRGGLGRAGVGREDGVETRRAGA